MDRYFVPAIIVLVAVTVVILMSRERRIRRKAAEKFRCAKRLCSEKLEAVKAEQAAFAMVFVDWLAAVSKADSGSLRTRFRIAQEVFSTATEAYAALIRAVGDGFAKNAPTSELLRGAESFSRVTSNLVCASDSFADASTEIRALERRFKDVKDTLLSADATLQKTEEVIARAFERGLRMEGKDEEKLATARKLREEAGQKMRDKKIGEAGDAAASAAAWAEDVKRSIEEALERNDETDKAIGEQKLRLTALEALLPLRKEALRVIKFRYAREAWDAFNQHPSTAQELLSAAQNALLQAADAFSRKELDAATALSCEAERKLNSAEELLQSILYLEERLNEPAQIGRFMKPEVRSCLVL